MSLYDLTRKLVARGCPEHPRVRYSERPWHTGTHWGYHDEDDGEPLMSADESDARAIWTCWALEWAQDALPGHYWWSSEGESLHDLMICRRDTSAPLHLAVGDCADGVLEAIEAATRHLEPQ